MTSSQSNMVKRLLPLAVVIFGVLMLVVLVKSKSRPKKSKPPAKAAMVNLVGVQTLDRAFDVRAQGEVVPAQEIVLQPEVAGRVIWLHAQLAAGGHLKKGEILLKIDSRDYSLAVAERQAQVDKARVDLQLEEGRGVVAQKEWALLDGQIETSTSGKALALREPQLQVAKVALQAAEAGLAKARLNLSRTVLRAPFDAYVQAESVDLGQVISQASRVATLVGTESVWIATSFGVDDLHWIQLPDSDGRGGATAKITYSVGSIEHHYEATVLRLSGELDRVGRMAKLVLEVKDPFRRDAPSDMPLFVGAYVDVAIESVAEVSLVQIPRGVLREGERVYVVGEDGILHIRDLNIVFRDEDFVYASSGLSADEKVTATPLDHPIDGMKVRIRGKVGARHASPVHAEAQEGKGRKGKGKKDRAGDEDE